MNKPANQLLHLTEQVRNLYKSKGLTQAQLADIIGISPSAMQTRLNGTTIFAVTEVWDIEDFFNVTFVKGSPVPNAIFSR